MASVRIYLRQSKLRKNKREERSLGQVIWKVKEAELIRQHMLNIFGVQS